MINEQRQDPITGDWVIIAESRSKRPGYFTQTNGKKLLDYDRECFFCPGNEHLTPPEILGYRNGDVWWARTVLNKFPFLSKNLESLIQGQPQIVRDGMYIKMFPYGIHEVIIETPQHNEDIPFRKLDRVREMLWMYKDRLIAHKAEVGLGNVLIFKNKGEEAAASLEHPHSQLTDSPMDTQWLNWEIGGSHRYFLRENYMGKKGQCGYCDVINQELELKDVGGIDSGKNKVIANNTYFIAFLPYASRFPFETCITPKFHQSDYTTISPDEATNLAEITKEVFEKLSRALPNFDYNMVLHTTPLNSLVQEHYHWHIEVILRGLTRIGGFELGTRHFVNITAPETAARIILEKS